MVTFVLRSYGCSLLLAVAPRMMLPLLAEKSPLRF